MIDFSPRALDELKTLVADRNEPPLVRVAIAGSGRDGFYYRMTLEREPAPEDTVIDLEGLKVLVDARSARYLEGTRVDYVEAAEGSGFQFDNPHSRDTCGYGQTFQA